MPASLNEYTVDVLGEQYEGTSLRLRKSPIYTVCQHEFEEGETGVDISLHKTVELSIFLKPIRRGNEELFGIFVEQHAEYCDFILHFRVICTVLIWGLKKDETGKQFAMQILLDQCLTVHPLLYVHLNLGQHEQLKGNWAMRPDFEVGEGT